MYVTKVVVNCLEKGKTHLHGAFNSCTIFHQLQQQLGKLLARSYVDLPHVNTNI